MTGAGCDVSVVVPSRDRPAQLADCLRALAAQEYPRGRYEVIVVDDGSATPAGPLVGDLDLDLEVRVISQPNRGPAAARNAGVEHARGTILAFTDDDCLPEPEWLGALVRAISASPAPVMVGGRVVNALTRSPCSAASQLIVDLVYDHYNPDPERARFFATNNMALPRAAFRELGGFDPEFRTSEDRDLCDRWLSRGYALRFAPQARVAHAHRLTLAAFVRQHFDYGRGAHRFLRRYSGRHQGRSSISSAFYLELPRRVWSRLDGPLPLRAALVSLLLVWQAANSAGFLVEAVGHRVRRDGDGP